MSDNHQELPSETEADSASNPIPDLSEILDHFCTAAKTTQPIRPDMIPDIDLYMDQVTTFMDTHLQSTKRYETDKALTKTMINNYTKNNLLPPPVKKKYSRDHILMLIFIYYFKNFLSINDIQMLLEPLQMNFFQASGQTLTLSEVYAEILKCTDRFKEETLEEILKNYTDSRQSFQNFPDLDPQTQEELADFSFICMLCEDIYVKKQLLEQIIDRKYSPMHEELHPGKHK